MKKIGLVSFALAIAMQSHALSVKPAYTVMGNDTTVQIFLYSPDSRQGLHAAYMGDDECWHEIGKLLDSDYGPWGSDKKMFHPFVTKANDGTWRALWGVNDKAPAFAVAYSEDLLIWRPQDYPVLREKGVSEPVAYEMQDGTWDVYVKTKEGKRYLHGDQQMRHFEEDSLMVTADDILWDRDTATVNGKCYQGNEFDIPLLHLNYLASELQARDMQNEADTKALPLVFMDNAGKPVTSPVFATLDVDFNHTKQISDRLYGIFFEDISYGADGGLWAEMIQNGDFEYNKDDRKKVWNATTAWKPELKIDTKQPLSRNNPHYAVLSKAPVYNYGWDGIEIKRGAQYTISFYARNIDANSKREKLRIALLNGNHEVITDAKFKVENHQWSYYQAIFNIEDKPKKNISLDKVFLAIIPDEKAKGEIAIDMVSLVPQDTYKGHGLRKDLAETIAELQPKFVRFPGGCMLHGDGLGNIYHWKESIGKYQDRKPAPNIWRYHQTKRMGFYEYFQWCEDMGAEPLPVLAAGVPCQNSQANEDGLAGQQNGIPMSQMPAYVQDVLDLIEWANGDANTSNWAKMRAEAGHPAPFNLKMIGIGNEDLISTVFEERYLMISRAVKAKYPDMEVIGTVGPFHYPSSDYIEGWKIAKREKFKDSKGNVANLFSAVDEHYYEQPSWFLNHQNYYDDYDRKASKVYLGEYASRGKDEKDNALAEALHLTNIERNGDVVEMASYAPMLCKVGHSNWQPDMIYFTNRDVKTTLNYQVQKDFSTHSGDIYVESKLNIDEALKKYVGISVVKNSKSNKTWLRVVNILSQPLNLKIGEKTIIVNARDWKVIEL